MALLRPLFARSYMLKRTSSCYQKCFTQIRCMSLESTSKTQPSRSSISASEVTRRPKEEHTDDNFPELPDLSEFADLMGEEPKKTEEPPKSQPVILSTDPGPAVTQIDYSKPVSPPGSRVSRIAILGTPNSGKSTIINALTSYKVSAVSRKMNTTRERVMGIVTEGTAQLLFVDTPGILPLMSDMRDKSKGPNLLVSTAWSAIHSTDIVMLVINCDEDLGKREKLIIEQLYERKVKNVVLVLNKIDMVENKTNLLVTADRINKKLPVKATFMTCAISGESMGDIKDYLLSAAKPGEWEFATDLHTDQTVFKQIEEIIREKVFQRMHQEIPYTISQQHVSWSDYGDYVQIERNIVVQRPSHQRLLVRPEGGALGFIQSQSQKEIEKLLNRTVKLRLNVKCNK
eukprot:199788_1